MMKKVISVFMIFMMIFSLAACGQTDEKKSNEDNSAANGPVQSDTEADNISETEPSEKGSKTAKAPHENGKTLIVYFSWSSSGNTKKMASYIQEQTNGDLLEIQPQNPYPTDYNECTDVALTERDENARPKIANLPDSIEEYDTIFIG